jgi:Thiol-activated cytolysin
MKKFNVVLKSFMCQNIFFVGQILPVFLLFIVTTISAQPLPKILNKASGKTIELRKIERKPTGVASSTSSTLASVASKSFTMSNGGTRTVKLVKGNNTIAFSPSTRNGGAATTGDMICTTEFINGERGGIDASNLNPATQAIYPGSIIDGLTVPSGDYRQITAARNPIVISISSNANGVSLAESVEKPDVATIRNAVTKILQGKTNNFVPEEREDNTFVARSEEDVMLALNVHAKSLLGNTVNFSSTFQSNAKQMTFIRIVKDRFFSVDVVPPVDDVDFFENTATQILPAWTYVSSMKYGRLGMLIITVTTKEREITADLQAKYKAGFSVNGSFSADLANRTENIEIRSFNRGGAALNISANNSTGVAAAMQNFNNWIQTGASNPEPFTYTLNFVKYENGGPAVASINSVLSYTQRTCRALQPRYEVTFKEIKCLGVDDSDGDPGEDVTGYVDVVAFNSNNQGIAPLFGKSALLFRETNCGKSLTKGRSYVIPDGMRTYEVNPSDRDARVTIGGDLDEDDNCGAINTGKDDEYDDQNGARTRRDIFFKDISTSPMTVVFDHRSGGSHVQQIWTLRKILVDK